MAQDYVELASNVMLHPLSHLGPYGYALTRDAADGCVTRVPDYEVRSKLTPAYQLHHMSALGFLKSAVRRPVVIERWSPYEIAIFEASLAEYGKDFPKVKKEIGDTKTTSEVIEFYYIWKKTSHYAKWKKEYVPEYLDVSESDGINIKVNAKQKV